MRALGQIQVADDAESVAVIVRGRGTFGARFFWERPLSTYPRDQHAAIRRKVRRALFRAVRQRIFLTFAADALMFIRKGGQPS